ncbi:protein FAM227B isoform X2 [Eleutherodactylus coqui]
MQHPPATFQEFLNLKHLKDWPEIPSVEEPSHKELLTVPRYSFDKIHKQFLENAPFSVSAFGDVEEKIDKNVTLLDNYASQILCLPALDDDKHSLARVFVTEVDMPERYQNEQENIKNCVFSVFERTDLPGNLKALQILQNVAKVQTLKEGSGKILLKLLLSEKSVAIFKDCVWWFFLQKFKPQKVEQDYLFNRISDTFVDLFCSIPQDVKDLFFQMYPDYLSQAIFTAFHNAFPQSHAQFNGEIRTEIVDLIFQWVSGIKPVPCSWKKWNLVILECLKNDQNSHENIYMSQNRYLSDVRRKLEFNLDDILDEARQQNLTRTLDTEDKNAPTKESHSIGPGPEFHHVLFQLGSHSLLVSNYLKRHHFGGCLYGRLRHRIKRTEISHLPPIHQTYQDIIKETQGLRKSLQQKYDVLETKAQKEIEEIRHQNVKVKYKILKLEQELSSGVKLNSTLLLEKLQKMSFSSKLFRKKDLTIQDILDDDNECEPATEQTFIML